MKIAIPRERKAGERRVAITPDGAAYLIKKGHQVFIEKDAGILSGFPTAGYARMGAEILDTLEEIWKKADLLVKVKEPAPEELSYFRPGLAVFSFLHPVSAPEMMKKLLEQQVVGLDYDLVTLDDGTLPILEPMSAIAGKLAVQCGATFLQANHQGLGVLLGGVPGVKPAKVVVVGAGIAGSNAAKTALAMGANVTILDINTKKLEKLLSERPSLNTIFSTPAALQKEISEADLIIGAVLIPGALSPKLLTREMLSTMKKGSVIVDICIDQGGFAETSRTTSITEPIFVESGVIHYCVPNMPALVPETSTKALTNATLPWIEKIASLGIEGSIKMHQEIKCSVVSYQGELTNQEIGEALGIKYNLNFI